jgi:hypothetical protein
MSIDSLRDERIGRGREWDEENEKCKEEFEHEFISNISYNEGLIFIFLEKVLSSFQCLLSFFRILKQMNPLYCIQ